jgi:flagellar hook protein FlgE
MSIAGSMFTAKTALDAFGESMGVIGHNIANLNTVGFKSSRMDFADILPTIMGELETGHGVRVSDVSGPFQQGAIETSENVTDLAIQGGGYFVLHNANGDTFYTRAGQFHLNNIQELVNPEGLNLQGAAGNISLAGVVTVPATVTSALALALNLDATAVTPAAAFPVGTDASQTAWISASNFSAIAAIYDSAGQSHDLTFLFRQSAPNTWDYQVVAARSELDPLAPTSTDLRQVGMGGTLVFSSDGTLNLGASTITDISGLSWVGGAGSQTISASNLNFAGTVQYGGSSALLSMSQDGSAQGLLTGIRIDGQGVITAQYSNGQFRLIDTVMLAIFPNGDGLDPLGDSLLAQSVDSGAAQVAPAGQGGRGSILSGGLELSTVDLAQEFVSLLTSQRSFQMNSRVITVADEMFTVAADLKT